MAYDGFDNINLLVAQAAIEAEMNLFENGSSGHAPFLSSRCRWQQNSTRERESKNWSKTKEIKIIISLRIFYEQIFI